MDHPRRTGHNDCYDAKDYPSNEVIEQPLVRPECQENIGCEGPRYERGKSSFDGDDNVFSHTFQVTTLSFAITKIVLNLTNLQGSTFQ